MRQCQIRVRFESGVKTKFLAALNQLLTSFFQCHNLPWSHSFQKRYDMYIVKINGQEGKWVLGQKTFLFSSKFVKVFLNNSCQIALFSLCTSLSGRIHILSKRYSPWEQTCWLLSTDCTKENEFWHPLCKLLLSSQDRAKSLFCTFFYFFCSDDHIFLFTRSHFIPILIVYHLIQFSKEEN